MRWTQRWKLWRGFEMASVILTRADGTPIDRPEPPPKGCSVEKSIAYMRAMWSFHDEVADVANAAFVSEFRKKSRHPT